MVEVFEGRLGGGKTYSATIRVVGHLAQGGTVVTNVALNRDAVASYVEKHWRVAIDDTQFRVVDGSTLLSLPEWCPSGTRALPVLVVVDEAHIWLGVRETMAKEKKAFADWMTQTRKLNIDVIFITQNASNLDVRVVRLCQYIWRFRDLSRWIIPGIGSFPALCKFFTLGLVDGNFILQAQFDYDGKTLNDKHWLKKSPRIFELYDTDALLFDVAQSKEVVEPKKLAKVQRKPKEVKNMLKWVIPVGLVILFFSTKSLIKSYHNFGGGGAPAALSMTEAKKPATLIGSAAAPSPTPAYRIESEALRYADEFGIRTDKGEYVVGELSHLGFVEGIRGKMARIKAPDGATVYMLAGGSADFSATAAAHYTPAALPAEKKTVPPKLLPAQGRTLESPNLDATPAPLRLTNKGADNKNSNLE